MYWIVLGYSVIPMFVVSTPVRGLARVDILGVGAGGRGGGGGGMLTFIATAAT